MTSLEVEGTLFRYGSNGMVAMDSPCTTDFRIGYLVVIGGLTDGLLSLAYVPEFVEVFAPKGWNVVQVLLRSSYDMYGGNSISSDCEDLDQLVAALLQRYANDFDDGTPEICLLGHSTGCQDVVAFLRDGAQAASITSAVLQGPVSDRDYILSQPDMVQHRELAQKLYDEGKGTEWLPRNVSNVPITANRFLSLTGRLTADDMFSADLSDEELKAIFSHISIPTLWVFSLGDEYVPPSVDVRRLGERLEWAVPFDSECLFVENSNHSLAGKTDLFVQELHSFLMKTSKVFKHHYGSKRAAEEDPEDSNKRPHMEGDAACDDDAGTA